ncbi:Uncharacterized protein DBV15_08076 [Temnothorax longispinosus]|uniref:Uncharacterized protein n=1 Tax=Temnothorax longispinosus TaxID=300112 RepID=A0A4S2JRG5_9HYME|nr:Uncharacterized protein DBV15_08076 [Temnothorax longispinosus]
MTNIKASRKGMRLNDAQYFRLPLPHTRKRMMVIRVMPQGADTNYFHVVQDSTMSSNTGFGTKIRYHGKTLESKQSSVEIALVTTCSGFEGVDQNKEGRQDICVETETIGLLNDSSSLTRREDVPSIVQDDSEKFAEFPHAEDDRRETVQKVVCNSQELRRQVERGCKSVDRKRSCGDRVVEIEEEEEKCGSSWWRDGGQTILQFFAKILGKRGGIGARGPAGYVLPTGKQPGKRVKRVSRGGKGHNGCRRDVDRGIRLKRVDNGYIANHVYRDEGSRHDAVTENKPREKQQQQQQQQHHPSILVRQIQRTRDKNLRVMLLERELCTRLPKAARRDARLIGNGVSHRTSIAFTSFFAGSARYSSEFCSIPDTRSSTNSTSSLTLMSPIDVPKRNVVFRAGGSQFVAIR